MVRGPALPPTYVLEGGSASSSTTKSTCSDRAGSCTRRPASCTGSAASVGRGSSTSTRPTGASRTPFATATAAARGLFDSVDAEPGSGLPATEAILLDAGAGEALRANHRVATIKVGSDRLSLIELALEPAFGGPSPHTHDDHTDSFYGLDGTAELIVDGPRVVAEAGTFVAVPRGIERTFTSGPAGARLLNVHAPGVGFADRLRELSVAAAAPR